MKMMKRFTGTTWGDTQDVLVTIYKSYVLPVLELAAQRLKTHEKPLHKAAVLSEKYGIAETNKQPFSKLQYIEDKAEIPINTPVPGTVNLNKADMLTAQLKSETLAMIAESYPSEEWIHVYMDGSQQ
ncbi:hypothetical protein CDAR_582551 [Caerostris darwini]|uniref:Uncharacterized protein n=1 Tax=Caerostris darwini TaxID=1538125 RepID=A0AAV4PPK1_9ARAC|nr:hypothetical protein CDAR_582551 [Caerostris darwini]